MNNHLNNMNQIQYALLKWPTDGNLMSVSHLKHIKSPSKPWAEYKAGDTGRCVYPGKKGPDGDGLWKIEIVSVNASKKILEEKLCQLIKKRKKTTQNPTDAEISDEESPAVRKRLLLNSKQAADKTILSIREATSSCTKGRPTEGKSSCDNTSETTTYNNCFQETTPNRAVFPASQNTTSSGFMHQEQTPSAWRQTLNGSSIYSGNNNDSTPWNKVHGTFLDQPVHRPVAKFMPLLSDTLNDARLTLNEYHDMDLPNYPNYEQDQVSTPGSCKCACAEEVNALKLQFEQREPLITKLQADVRQLLKVVKASRDGASNELASSADIIFPTGISKTDVEKRLQSCHSLTSAVKELMPKVFTQGEMTNCSLKGQKCGKGVQSGFVRPAFDPERRDFLLVLLMQKFNATEKIVVDKMRNRIKIFRSQYSEYNSNYVQENTTEG